MNNKKKFIPVNFQIRAQKVICIDEERNLGLIDLREAVSLAQSKGLDLVQISQTKDNVPTCKVLDYGKYKFDLSKKEREAARKQRESQIKIKSIQFRPSTDEHDLRTKANKAIEFLDDGCKLKIEVSFRGRELAFKEIGYSTLGKFIEMVPGIHVIGEPVLTGKILSVMADRK